MTPAAIATGTKSTVRAAYTNFVSPLFVGDSIDVYIWDITDHTSSSSSLFDKSRPMNKDKKWVLFQVRHKSEETVVVDNGMVLLQKKPIQNGLAPDTIQSKL